MIQDKKKLETEKESTFKLKSLQELEGFDFDDSSAFVCDMETGVCGPEKKEEGNKK